ncbi:MAG: hypothetical protein ACRDFX_05400 [Chloroflexota bacterium]
MRLIVISDNAMMRRGLGTIVDATGGTVVLETAASKPFPAAADRVQCDLILFDVDTTPFGLALAICERMGRSANAIPLVAVCSLSPHLERAERLFEAGALAYTCLAPSALDVAAARCAAREEATAGGPEAGTEMGERDIRILQGVARGLHDWEIAEELGYSPDYVKHRVETNMHQYSLSGRAQLGMWMRDQGYVRTPRPPSRR